MEQENRSTSSIPIDRPGFDLQPAPDDSPVNEVDLKGLGAFGRLPYEIRQMIWLEVIKGSYIDEEYPGSESLRYLGGQDRLSYHKWHPHSNEPESECRECRLERMFGECRFDVFCLTSYDRANTGLRTQDLVNRKLMNPIPRLLSRYIKAEYEAFFLSSHNFAFETAESLGMFFDVLPENCQLPQISIIPWNMTHARPLVTMEEGWPKMFARLYGRGVKGVRFRLGTHCNDKIARPPFGYHMRKRSLTEVQLMRQHLFIYLPGMKVSVGGPQYNLMTQQHQKAFQNCLAKQLALGWLVDLENTTLEHLLQIVL